MILRNENNIKSGPWLVREKVFKEKIGMFIQGYCKEIYSFSHKFAENVKQRYVFSSFV